MKQTPNSLPCRQAGKLQTPKLILALDVDNFDKAKYFVNKLYPEIKIFKVGLQLFTACPEKIIKYIQKKGGKVFLDLKFFDIPNTVAEASRQVVRMQAVTMFTVHAQGGLEMMQAARKAVSDEADKLGIKPPLIIGVTVLTSRENKGNIINLVLSLSLLAKKAGMAGVVCSVGEASSVRRRLGKDFIIITPGIRLPHDERGGQRRIATPEEAEKAGSNYLVVGRPLLLAKEPLLAARGIKEIISRR